jgi:uncharacterized protein (DUF4415 family)
MKKTTSKRPPSASLKAELAALAALPDAAIDTTDIPEVLDWKGAERGRFYRPVKQQLTLRLDSDLIAWFKSRATGLEGYQTGINRALREYILRKSGKFRGVAAAKRERHPEVHSK